MWLENLEVRIKKYPQGYAVETQKVKYILGLFKVKHWVHIEAVSGMSDKPWYFHSKDVAAEEAAKHLKWDLLISCQYE